MGVAGLFGFLRRRYPEIVRNCVQQGADVQDAEGGDCDILHVDLNHILHACTHPSWREEAHVGGEEEMFLEVDLYLDRLVAISRPTQLVLVAMDGVAPSAKMSQQRGRRFYSAHLECQRWEIERQVRREMAAEMGPAGGGVEIPELPEHSFDANVITPGTTFMARVSAHLDMFFRQKLECDPSWRHLLVIFSDSSEPGEGEHKILRFIRQQRTRPDYQPNTRHCVFGQDADLILLGLLSHEPHFSILRESGTLDLALLRQAEEGAEEGAEEEGGAGTAAVWSPVGQQPLEVLRLSTLRDFLRCEFADFCGEQPALAVAQGGSGTGSPASGTGSPTCASRGKANSLESGEVDLITGQPKRVHPKAARQRHRRQHSEVQRADGTRGGRGSDEACEVAEGVGGGGGGFCFERIVDDVVFVTFLAGNDFLPHIPSLDIYDRPSALETCLDAYKELLGGGSGQHGGYLTNSGRVDTGRLCMLFTKLAALEVVTFEQREQRKVREQRRRMQQDAAATGGAGESAAGSACWMGGGDWVSLGGLAPGEKLEDVLAGIAQGDLPTTTQAALWASDGNALRRELLQRVKARMDDRAKAGMAADVVRLSMPGYRARYYRKCFGAEEEGGPGLERLVRSVCADYCCTLCWVLQYYFRGTPPVPANSDGAEAEPRGCAPPSRRAAKHSGKDTGGGGIVPYASWRQHYQHHYAPLASDLAKYGREALRGAMAAASASPADTPIQPFAQLCAVLPFSSMPVCLPQLAASQAADPDEGLLALHGGEAGAGAAMFPPDVSALVDLSGKKWSHTAVIRLPFPDVAAIEGFVDDLLASEAEGGRDSNEAAATARLAGCLTADDCSRNVSRPARLLVNVLHPLAQGLLHRRCGTADAVEAEGSGGSILSLLQQQEACAAAGGVSSADHAVLSLALDLAGQDTPPFSPGLLPGTVEGERAVTLQSWNKRKLAEQRRQADRALAALRGRSGAGCSHHASGGRGGRGGRAVAARDGARGAQEYATRIAAPAPAQGWRYEEADEVWTPPAVPTAHSLHPRSPQPVVATGIDAGWSVPKPKALGRRPSCSSSSAAHHPALGPTDFTCTGSLACDAGEIVGSGWQPAATTRRVEEADMLPRLVTLAQLSEDTPAAESAARGWDAVCAAPGSAGLIGSSDGDELEEMLALLGVG